MKGMVFTLCLKSKDRILKRQLERFNICSRLLGDTVDWYLILAWKSKVQEAGWQVPLWKGEMVATNVRSLCRHSTDWGGEGGIGNECVKVSVGPDVAK